MWDVRRPSQPVARFDAGRRGAMSVQFDASGRRLLCLRVKDYPVVFGASGPTQLRQPMTIDGSILVPQTRSTLIEAAWNCARRATSTPRR